MPMSAHVDHPAKMAAQDPDFPDYDERGWPNPLVGVLLNVRDDALRLREGAARLIGKAPSEEVTFLLRLADSLDNGAAPAEKYMAETAGPGLEKPALATREVELLREIRVNFGNLDQLSADWRNEARNLLLRIEQAAAGGGPASDGGRQP